jgi:hypothetical protein
MLRRSLYTNRYFARRKLAATNFLFFISRPALIDAILLAGIAFRQIR